MHFRSLLHQYFSHIAATFGQNLLTITIIKNTTTHRCKTASFRCGPISLLQAAGICHQNCHLMRQNSIAHLLHTGDFLNGSGNTLTSAFQNHLGRLARLQLFSVGNLKGQFQLHCISVAQINQLTAHINAVTQRAMNFHHLPGGRSANLKLVKIGLCVSQIKLADCITVLRLASVNLIKQLAGLNHISLFKRRAQNFAGYQRLYCIGIYRLHRANPLQGGYNIGALNQLITIGWALRTLLIINATHEPPASTASRQQQHHNQPKFF